MTRNVTVKLDEEMISAAKEAGVDLSDLLARALRRSLPDLQNKNREAADTEWQQENQEAIEAVNRLIEEHGLFSDGVRMF